MPNTIVSRKHEHVNYQLYTQNAEDSLTAGELQGPVCLSQVTATVMRRITTFRSTTDRIYDGGPIRL